jgi:hypothetical protein
LSKKNGRQNVHLPKVDVSRAGRTLSDSETELRRSSTSLQLAEEKEEEEEEEEEENKEEENEEE